MHLTALIINRNILLQTLCNSFVTYDNRAFTGKRIHYNLQNIEKFASVTTTLTEECIRFLDSYILFFENFIRAQCPLHQSAEILHIK